MDELDEKLRKVFKNKISLSNQYHQTIRKALNDLPEKNKRKSFEFPIFRTLATGFTCVVFSTGIVFARDISEKIYNFYGTGKGVETAINDGYIVENDSEYTDSPTEFSNEDTGIVIENSSAKVKVQDIVMDDFNLSATIVVDLPQEVLEQIPAEDIWEMHFPDLIVSDEEENVLFGMDYNGSVKEYFKEHFGEEDGKKIFESDKFYNSGLNNFISQRGTMPVKAVYNMYVESPEHYPKSKKLKFAFTKIAISNSDDTTYGNEEITIKGNWEIEVDLPSKFYNRQTSIYTAVDNENSEDKLLSCTVYNTNTIVELALKSKKQPRYSPYYTISKLLEEGEASDAIRDYIMQGIYRTEEYKKYSEEQQRYYDTQNIYIENSKGEKFEFTNGPIPNGGGSIDDEGIFHVSCMLDLTQKDATDEMTLHLNYLGKEIEIKLQKDKEE